MAKIRERKAKEHFMSSKKDNQIESNYNSRNQGKVKIKISNRNEGYSLKKEIRNKSVEEEYRAVTEIKEQKGQ